MHITYQIRDNIAQILPLHNLIYISKETIRNLTMQYILLIKYDNKLALKLDL